LKFKQSDYRHQAHYVHFA